MPSLNAFFRFTTSTPELTERAFADLLKQEQRPLLALALRFVGNIEEAKDLAQTAFIKLWQKRERLQTDRPARFYLRRMLVNLCIDHLRRKGRHEPMLELEEARLASSTSDPQHQLEREELQTRLQQCIELLSPKQKAVLLLRDVEGYSVAETADMLACSQNTVLGNLHLARKKVKEKMQVWMRATESQCS